MFKKDLKIKKKFYLLSFFIIILLLIVKQIYIVIDNQKNDYFNNPNNLDIRNSINNISSKLHNKNY